MRVLHIIDHLGLGGAQTFMVELACYQQRHTTIAPTVCCLTELTVLSTRLEQAGVPLIHFHVNRRNYAQVAAIPWRLNRLIRQGRYDLVHTHLFTSATFGRLAALTARVPSVNHEQCNEWSGVSGLIRTVDRALGPVTAMQICVSASTRDYNIRGKGIAPQRLIVIPNLVDPQRYRPAADPTLRTRVRAEFGLPAETPLVIGIGRLERQKRFDIFVQAAAAVLTQMPAAAFLVVGDGALRPALTQQAQELGVAARVHFTGARSDVATLLQAADLFLLTSDYEGLPVTLLEALATGIPAVATAVDGNVEVFAWGDVGALVPPAHPQAAADATLRLLAAPELRRKLGATGRAVVEEHYSPAVVCAQIEAVYRQVLAATHTPRPQAAPSGST